MARSAVRAAPLLAPALILIAAAATPRYALAADEAPPDPGALLDKLNNLTVDPSQVYFIRDARITRDGATVYFNRGFIGLLSPVQGEITGALFTGDGEVLLMPPDVADGESLAYFTSSPVLEERFSSAYLRFTDGTARELLSKTQAPDPQSPEQPGALLPAWNDVAQRLNSGQSLRILQDLLSDRRPEYFSADLQGVKLGAFALSIDERRPEAVLAVAPSEKDGTQYADVWCSFPSHSQTMPGSAWQPPFQVRSYRIETEIGRDKSLDGRAELELESGVPQRFLPFQLSGRLEVTAVRDESGAKLPAFQGTLALGPRVHERSDWLAVILPKAHPRGERFKLSFAYHGSVIADVGNGVLYVGAHSSWYPNTGPSPSASYDLSFDYPDNLTLVATGRLANESSADGIHHSHWVSDGVFPMAGFNLGPYDVRTRELGKVQVQVYATSGAEEALEARYHQLQAEANREQTELNRGSMAPPPENSLSPSALIDRVADNAAQTVRYFQTLFGPFPYPRLALAQIPGNFGQGWPELIYLPTFAFLPDFVRMQMTAKERFQGLEDRAVVPHEIAHQWWGNEVGWRTYHDQWLSEGFASYAAALSLTQERDGDRLFRRLLRDYRSDLLARNKEGKTVESEGPIWLGARLSNSLEPDGYDAIVYKKSCWVLHMLRLLMTDPRTGSDTRFFDMLRDFVSEYQGKSPSTEDFARHAEKYMTREADLEHDHRLDWFFREWVYSTGVPEYRLQTSTHRLESGAYRVEGSITETTHDRDFEMLVPVSISYRSAPHATRFRRILVPVTGAGGHFRFTTEIKPDRVTIDEDAILALVH
ncbi:MAG TPA: M1 family aminopeptidase [Terriglobia bacterium]|nr:M1 family aminopeptidase [Terriglobia bacterium]